MNIKNVAFRGGGHVVILGAGASIAASLDQPEKNGKGLPSMNNLPKVVNMDDLLGNIPKRLQSKNFETLYSNLYMDNPSNPILVEINKRIYNYFSDMKLPDKPTIYDYLVMALRPKDLIATFNWDPFLYQAWCRNCKHGANPRICFLHGNVAIGYDEEDLHAGPAGYTRKDNYHYFQPTPLLYPTGQKDYQTNPFIRREWERLQRDLHAKETWRVTIFGYSAPVSDMAAIDLMRAAWGSVSERNMEQFELIDIRPEEEVCASWDKFIHTHHYDYCNSYYDSSLAQFPRRTSEDYFLWCYPTTPEEAFHDSFPIPHGGFETFEEMWAWHQELIDAENSEKANPIF